MVYMTYCIIIIICLYLLKTWHEYYYKQCYTKNLHTMSLQKTTTCTCLSPGDACRQTCISGL